MAKKRKTISQMTRFEVFKRDSFTCQYCGEKAPDVVLEVDHIKPVAGGGDNEIMNLVTSCKGCNAGKGARELSDNQVIEKQRQQLEELNERRQQLEMLLQWKEGLSSLRDIEVQKLEEIFVKRVGITITDAGKQELKKAVKRFGMEEVLEAMDTSFTQYLVEANPKEGASRYTRESAEKAFNYISRICACRQRETEDPSWKDAYYVRGILRNRLSYINHQEAVDIVRQAIETGVKAEDIKSIARYCSSWTNFKNSIFDMMEAERG